MKKRLFATFIALVFMLSAFPIQALANDSAQTELVYTHNTSTYEITVPATIDLNSTNNLAFTAKKLDIAAGEWVAVEISSASYENGKFYLYYDKGLSTEEKLSCSFMSNGFDITGNEQQIAVFHAGDSTITSDLTFSLDSTGAVRGHTYTGTLYFDIVFSGS